MASVYVSIGDVGAKATNGIAEVFRSGTLASEVITSSGTTASGSLEAGKGQVARIICATAVYATAAEAPVATATNGVYVPANLPTYIAMREGDKIAVIDVA